MPRIAARVTTVSILALLGVAATAPVTGCKGGMGSITGSPTAMERLSPLVKDAANSYIKNINALIQSLEKVNDIPSAVRAANTLEPTVKDINSAYSTLAGTRGEERSNLLKAFGPQLDSATESFTKEADKITGNVMFGHVPGPVLKQVKLFRH